MFLFRHTLGIQLVTRIIVVNEFGIDAWEKCCHRFIFLESFTPLTRYKIAIRERYNHEWNNIKVEDERRSMEAWAKNMGTVHPIIHDDMDYVYKQVFDRADFDGSMKNSQCGWKTIALRFG